MRNFKYTKSILFYTVLALITYSCSGSFSANTTSVSNEEELMEALKELEAGDQILLEDGVYKDVQLVVSGQGTESKPIIVKAKNSGKASIEGESNLKLGGNYIEISGLYFKNGHTPDKTVINFRVNDTLFAKNSKLTDCVIEEFTQPDRDVSDHWIELWGRNNEVSNNYIAGKSNFGPTVMVMLKGNEHIKNNHQIVNNHFGPRPRKGGPHGETLQIGDSGTSMMPSYTNVSNNLFDRCNGEVEIISSKSNFNIFKNNVFFESEGSLVLRHGNFATIDGNVFIGNDNSKFIGGIRVINTGHWITNNYFYKLKGSIFRGPIAVMNGIPKSPQNRYNQVTDAVIAYNSFIDCQSPFHFSVGSNVSQSEVLPKSEIRSARPKRTVVANNVLYNSTADNNPIVQYDSIDGVQFENNYTNSQNNSEYKPEGLIYVESDENTDSEEKFVSSISDDTIFNGFDFETISTDVFGNKRNTDSNGVGAILSFSGSNILDVDRTKYGASWFSSEKEKPESKTIAVTSSEELLKAFETAQNGDVIALDKGEYTLGETIVLNKDIQVVSNNGEEKATILFTSDSTAFQMRPKGMVHFENVILKGNNTQNAFTTLSKNMSSAYGIWLNHSEVHNFKSILEVSKGSFADTISVKNSVLKNCANGIQLNKETNNKGDYNAEFLIIENNTFDGIGKNTIDYYRGGYDESTIGGNLVVKGNTFTNCGRGDNLLIKNRGIVQVDMSDNTFKNNAVSTIAVLWGEKGQEPINNTIQNSGKFQIVQNLKLSLMY